MFKNQVPPNNREAEEMVLAAIAMDNTLISKTDLVPGDFYVKGNGDIFKAMLDLHANREPIDAVSVAHKLTAGDGHLLVGMQERLVTTANIRYHANIVRELSLKRKLRTVCIDVMSNIDDSSIDELLSRLRTTTASLVRGHGGEIIDFSVIAKELGEFCERRNGESGELSGLTSGYEAVDGLTDGFQNGDLIIVAGRPGVGKSIWAMSVAEAVAKNGDAVGIISLEMGKHQLGIRSLSSLSKVEMWRLRKGYIQREQWPSVMRALAEMAELPVYFSFSARKTGELEKVVTQMVERHGIKLLVVDYLQLAKSSETKKREQEVAEVSRLLKTMAQIHNIPVIALAQLNRAMEKENRRPILSDLRESGAIEQDADVVIFLYKAPDGVVEVIFAKGRNIGLGIAYLYWHGDTMTFTQLSEEETRGRKGA